MSKIKPLAHPFILVHPIIVVLVFAASIRDVVLRSAKQDTNPPYRQSHRPQTSPSVVSRAGQHTYHLVILFIVLAVIVFFLVSNLTTDTRDQPRTTVDLHSESRVAVEIRAVVARHFHV